MHTEYSQIIDIASQGEQVEVEVSETVGRSGLLTLWVNIDGICRLRVTAMAPEHFTARIKSGATVRRPRG